MRAKRKSRASKDNAKIIRELLDGETYFHQQLIECRKVRDGWKRQYDQAAILCGASFDAGLSWKLRAEAYRNIIERAKDYLPGAGRHAFKILDEADKLDKEGK